MKHVHGGCSINFEPTKKKIEFKIFFVIKIHEISLFNQSMPLNHIGHLVCFLYSKNLTLGTNDI
jgi:hypothetical protein